jgi:hypothetical protein
MVKNEMPEIRSFWIPILTYNMGKGSRPGRFSYQQEKIVIDIRVCNGLTALMPTNDTDSVREMREHALKELADAKNRVAVLAARVQAFDDVLAMANNDSAPKADGSSPGGNWGALTLVEAGPTDAAYAVVKKYGQGKKLPGSEVRSLMMQHGYRYNGNVANFALSLYKVLRRLHDQGKIEGEMQNGNWVFWAKVG